MDAQLVDVVLQHDDVEHEQVEVVLHALLVVLVEAAERSSVMARSYTSNVSTSSAAISARSIVMVPSFRRRDLRERHSEYSRRGDQTQHGDDREDRLLTARPARDRGDTRRECADHSDEGERAGRSDVGEAEVQHRRGDGARNSDHSADGRESLETARVDRFFSRHFGFLPVIGCHAHGTPPPPRPR
ncbi:hypothetical protein O1W71_14025 [Microbacterium sp. H37-C3]|uniref:hypothetical protein n=1 Tax=Microbacterium sp. H37-C3 TaxID=3004354 RepID=UPI0022AEA1C4|nr:hypothetical protein [Microbacterium sp. H37-C3]MCZ4068792.1 hypothetical protein [Microbacterium sp. H37-C3]